MSRRKPEECKGHTSKAVEDGNDEKMNRVYSVLMFMSLLLYLMNFLVQGQFIFTYIDLYGIILKLGTFYWLGYLTMVGLIAFQYSQFQKLDERYVYTTLFIVVIYLIATPFLYEDLPRFEDTWGHSYLAQQMFLDQRVDMGTSIYEEYPGSFLFYGLLFNFIPSYYMMKFFPPVFYFLGIVIVYEMFSDVLDRHTAFLIPILYMLFNWTVEDNHISPQFLVLNLYLMFMYITLRFFYEKDRSKTLGYLVVLTFLSAAITVSHPFTPIFLMFIMAGFFVLVKEFRWKSFIIGFLVFVFFTAYGLLQTTSFDSISRHANDFFDFLLYGPSMEDLTDRFGTDLLSRKVFLVSRLGLTGMSVLLGLAGAFFMIRGDMKAEAKMLFTWAFALVPFVIFVGIAVKGEFYERFALVSSLPLAAATSYLFRHFKIGFFQLVIFLLVISPFYFVGKYGNEAFESISREKLMANCFADQSSVDCIDEYIVVGSPLYYDFDDLDVYRFVFSRESGMASFVMRTGDLGAVRQKLDQMVEEHQLNKIYASTEAAVYTVV